MPRHFLSLADHTEQELRELLDLARMIKANPRAFRDACEGKTLAMIFTKPSLRTRVSFETGIYQLGGRGLFLGASDIQLHRGESIGDTATVLGRFVDGIMARVHGHSDVVELAEKADVPVINGLSDFNHPCQVLADLLTLKEKRVTLAGCTLAYVGDGNNMSHSLLVGAAIMGMHVRVAHPEGYAPASQTVAWARAKATETGGSVLVTRDPHEAVTAADAIYTDAWTSMGWEDEADERTARFQGFQVDASLMARAKKGAIFMHCLPAHRGEEVAGPVIDGPQSVIFDQAENRLHAQKAIMVKLMGHRH
ncbi:MAG: ornithine carbamoyltransferase [Myxococcota bacterium]|nr:ornithine carbamoyltransferase [Myxococcota bacterium]